MILRMTRCALFTILAAFLLLTPPASAQQPEKAPDRGNLPDLPPDSPAKDLPIVLPVPDFEESMFDPTGLYGDFCQKALAAVSCKKPFEFNFVREVNGVYLYNSFYGSSPHDFYCFPEEGDHLLLSSSAWGKIRITVPVQVDKKNQCLRASVRSYMCERATAVSSCAKKRK